MASWILVPCLVSLRNEFNKLAPGRDKASDGSIGDTAHQQESSDHNPDETGRTPYEDADKVNEVHAIDVDDDLRKAGWTMDRCLQIIITRHRTGKDDRLQNVIYNRRIWSRSWGWTAREYTGASAHTEHAHFSARYTTAQESDTRSWGLLDSTKEDDVSEQDVTNALEKFFARGKQADGTITSRIGRDALDQGIPDALTGKKSNAWLALQHIGGAVSKLSALVAAMAEDEVTQADIDALKAAVENVDEQVIDQLKGSTPEETAALLKAALGDQAAEVGRILAGA